MNDSRNMFGEEATAIPKVGRKDVAKLFLFDFSSGILVLRYKLLFDVVPDLSTTQSLEPADRWRELTCIPQTRVPSVLLVVRSHFFLWLFFFSGVASQPYCLVPILRSRTHGCFSRPVRSSMKIKYSCRVMLSSRGELSSSSSSGEGESLLSGVECEWATEWQLSSSSDMTEQGLTVDFLAMGHTFIH